MSAIANLTVAIVNAETGGLYDRVYAQVGAWARQPARAPEAACAYLQGAQQAERPLDEILESTARRYLIQANDPRMIAETKAPQAMAIAAQSIDKMRLMRELSTETIQIVLLLTESFQTRGISASDAFTAMLQEMARIPKVADR